MRRGCSSIREVAKPESNRLKSGELLKATRNVTSSNLVTPILPPDTRKLVFSYNDKIRKIHMPHVLDKILAEDIGIQIGDGSLPVYIDKRGVRHYIIGCYGNIKEDREYLTNFVAPLKKKLFNIDLKVKNHPTAGTCYIKFESKVIFNFYKDIIGLQTGRKNNISIPKIILKSPLEIKLACIRGIADTDFSLVFKKDFRRIHRDPYIQLGCASKNLILQISKILREVKIISTLILDSKEHIRGLTKEYIRHYLQIHGKKNLERWMKLIGFHNPVQMTKYLIWKRFCFCPPKTDLKQRTEILENQLNPPTLETVG